MLDIPGATYGVEDNADIAESLSENGFIHGPLQDASGATVRVFAHNSAERLEDALRRAKEKVTELLTELHIDHLRASPAGSLSGGERRRVEIARAFLLLCLQGRVEAIGQVELSFGRPGDRTFPASR